MNLPRCLLSLETSTLADWRAWSRTLTNMELSQAQSLISNYLLKGDIDYFNRLVEIRAAMRETMCERFPTMAAQIVFLDNELRKAKALSRMEVTRE
jgi:hypothetical protein